MIGIILLSLFFFLLVAYLIWEQWKHWTYVRGIPGPLTIPLLGNALRFKGVDIDGLVEVMTAFQNDYGTPFKLWLGPLLIVAVSEPEHLEVVLKGSENLKKSEVYYFFRDFVKGVFTTEGEQWVKMRKIVNSMFMSSLRIDQIVVFNEKANGLMKILDKYGDNETVNLQDIISSCILGIIIKTSMGVDLEPGDKDGIEFMADVRECTEITLYRIIQIWLHPDFIFRNTSKGKKRKKLIQNIVSFLQNIMRRRREIIKTKKLEEKGAAVTQRTYMDQMFDYANEEKIFDEELALVINDVIVAGTDTTSATAAYTLTMLGMYQDIQEKVYSEIKEVFGDSDRDATLEDLNKLTQLDMAIKESLRIMGPPHLGRGLVKEIKLGNDVIPVGTTVYMAVYKLHRDPRFWERPDSYYPEHFLPENVNKRPKYAYVPFSNGLRICPGHKFSSYVNKTLISTILRRYHINCDLKPSDLKYSITFLLELSNGYPVQLHRRIENKEVF